MEPSVGVKHETCRSRQAELRSHLVLSATDQGVHFVKSLALLTTATSVYAPNSHGGSGGSVAQLDRVVGNRFKSVALKVHLERLKYVRVACNVETLGRTIHNREWMLLTEPKTVQPSKIAGVAEATRKWMLPMRYSTREFSGIHAS